MIRSHKYTVNKGSFNKCVNNGTFVLRSKLELKFAKLIDSSSNVIRWACEPFSIQYYFTYDKKYHRYTPDFIVETTDGVSIVEIKPYKKLIMESQKTNLDKIDFIKNRDKWEAIEKYCKEQNMTFRVVTEKDIK